MKLTLCFLLFLLTPTLLLAGEIQEGCAPEVVCGELDGTFGGFEEEWGDEAAVETADAMRGRSVSILRVGLGAGRS